MDELLQSLEERVRELLLKHHQMKAETDHYHQDKSLLIKEKNILVAKQDRAILQIESLVTRLKSIEKQL